MCVTAHWLTETWEYKEIVLGFEPLQGSHMAKALMDCFVQVVEWFSLQQWVLAITTNNASNVKSMVKLLQMHTEDTSNGW